MKRDFPEQRFPGNKRTDYTVHPDFKAGHIDPYDNDEYARSHEDVIHHRYKGFDIYSDRKAIVLKNAEGFYVLCYISNELVKRVDVYKHAERFAEDTADNFVLGILNP